MSPKCDRKGFTLVEIMVAGALSLLVMGLVYAFLVPTMRAQLRGSTRAQLQLEATTALEAMARDLYRSAPGAWSLRTERPAALGLMRQDTVLATGQRAWESFVIVYAQLDDRLVRRQWPPEPPSLGIPLPGGGAPLRLGAAELAQVANTPAAQSRWLARDVETLAFTQEGDCLMLSLTLNRRIDRVTVHRAVWPRSGL
ncbi:MAG: hypothetical protein AMXMBFR33_01230 [Candidatus Xenobia bacterium]